jgi:hypothetical protein
MALQTRDYSATVLSAQRAIASRVDRRSMVGVTPARMACPRATRTLSRKRGGCPSGVSSITFMADMQARYAMNPGVSRGNRTCSAVYLAPGAGGGGSGVWWSVLPKGAAESEILAFQTAADGSHPLEESGARAREPRVRGCDCLDDDRKVRNLTLGAGGRVALPRASSARRPASPTAQAREPTARGHRGKAGRSGSMVSRALTAAACST